MAEKSYNQPHFRNGLANLREFNLSRRKEIRNYILRLLCLAGQRFPESSCMIQQSDHSEVRDSLLWSSLASGSAEGIRILHSRERFTRIPKPSQVVLKSKTEESWDCGIF